LKKREYLFFQSRGRKPSPEERRELERDVVTSYIQEVLEAENEYDDLVEQFDAFQKDNKEYIDEGYLTEIGIDVKDLMVIAGVDEDVAEQQWPEYYEMAMERIKKAQELEDAVRMMRQGGRKPYISPEHAARIIVPGNISGKDTASGEPKHREELTLEELAELRQREDYTYDTELESVYCSLILNRAVDRFVAETGMHPTRREAKRIREGVIMDYLTDPVMRAWTEEMHARLSRPDTEEDDDFDEDEFASRGSVMDVLLFSGWSGQSIARDWEGYLRKAHSRITGETAAESGEEKPIDRGSLEDLAESGDESGDDRESRLRRQLWGIRVDLAVTEFYEQQKRTPSSQELAEIKDNIFVDCLVNSLTRSFNPERLSELWDGYVAEKEDRSQEKTHQEAGYDLVREVNSRSGLIDERVVADHWTKYWETAFKKIRGEERTVSEPTLDKMSLKELTRLRNRDDYTVDVEVEKAYCTHMVEAASSRFIEENEGRYPTKQEYSDIQDGVAVDYLVESLLATTDEETRSQLFEGIKADRAVWAAENHMGTGMNIRNLLSKVGLVPWPVLETHWSEYAEKAFRKIFGEETPAVEQKSLDEMTLEELTNWRESADYQFNDEVEKVYFNRLLHRELDNFTGQNGKLPSADELALIRDKLAVDYLVETLCADYTAENLQKHWEEYNSDRDAWVSENMMDFGATAIHALTIPGFLDAVDVEETWLHYTGNALAKIAGEGVPAGDSFGGLDGQLVQGEEKGESQLDILRKLRQSDDYLFDDDLERIYCGHLLDDATAVFLREHGRYALKEEMSPIKDRLAVDYLIEMLTDFELLDENALAEEWESYKSNREEWIRNDCKNWGSSAVEYLSNSGLIDEDELEQRWHEYAGRALAKICGEPFPEDTVSHEGLFGPITPAGDGSGDGLFGKVIHAEEVFKARNGKPVEGEEQKSPGEMSLEELIEFRNRDDYKTDNTVEVAYYRAQGAHFLGAELKRFVKEHGREPSDKELSEIKCQATVNYLTVTLFDYETKESMAKEWELFKANREKWILRQHADLQPAMMYLLEKSGLVDFSDAEETWPDYAGKAFARILGEETPEPDPSNVRHLKVIQGGEHKSLDSMTLNELMEFRKQDGYERNDEVEKAYCKRFLETRVKAVASNRDGELSEGDLAAVQDMVAIHYVAEMIRKYNTLEEVLQCMDAYDNDKDKWITDHHMLGLGIPVRKNLAIAGVDWRFAEEHWPEYTRRALGNIRRYDFVFEMSLEKINEVRQTEGYTPDIDIENRYCDLLYREAMSRAVKKNNLRAPDEVECAAMREEIAIDYLIETLTASKTPEQLSELWPGILECKNRWAFNHSYRGGRQIRAALNRSGLLNTPAVEQQWHNYALKAYLKMTGQDPYVSPFNKRWFPSPLTKAGFQRPSNLTLDEYTAIAETILREISQEELRIFTKMLHASGEPEIFGCKGVVKVDDEELDVEAFGTNVQEIMERKGIPVEDAQRHWAAYLTEVNLDFFHFSYDSTDFFKWKYGELLYTLFDQEGKQNQYKQDIQELEKVAFLSFKTQQSPEQYKRDMSYIMESSLWQSPLGVAYIKRLFEFARDQGICDDINRPIDILPITPTAAHPLSLKSGAEVERRLGLPGFIENMDYMPLLKEHIAKVKAEVGSTPEKEREAVRLVQNAFGRDELVEIVVQSRRDYLAWVNANYDPWFVTLLDDDDLARDTAEYPDDKMYCGRTMHALHKVFEEVEKMEDLWGFYLLSAIRNTFSDYELGGMTKIGSEFIPDDV
jgi:hypothetical protein